MDYKLKFPCSICGEVHKLLPTIEHPQPDILRNIPLHEIKKRVYSNHFLHIIDKSIVFIKGKIKLELIEDDFELNLIVWVRIENFKEQVKVFKKNTLNYIMNGVLENDLYLYPNTKGSEVKVIFQHSELTKLPEITIETTNNEDFLNEWIFGLPKSKLIRFWENTNHNL